jgi:glycosyltransferase involved in cell wall biosynthesis
VRLLFLNPIGNVGGAERVLLTAIAGVKRERPDAGVRVVALAGGPLLDAARELGAEAEVVPLPAAFGELGDSRPRGRLSMFLRSVPRLPLLWSFVARLKAAVARFDPNLVHSNGIKTHLLGRFAVPARVPVVWHLHDFYGLRPVAGWLLRRARSRVRAAVAISNAVAADARSVLPGVRVEVVPNAVDLARFSPGPGDGGDLDRSAGLSPAPQGTVRVGLVATYARWKGHLTVLDAAAKLSAEAPTLPVRWYIVGGPIYHTAAQFTEAELRAEAESRGLGGRVGFVGFVPDPGPVYRALDVVLHASTQPEPFGLTVAEAMACGRAVVVSAAGGAAELFTDGVDALGITPGSADQLASAVRRLVGNPELRVRLGTSARSTAVERFDANRYGLQLCQVYRSVVNRAF